MTYKLNWQVGGSTYDLLQEANELLAENERLRAVLDSYRQILLDAGLAEREDIVGQIG